ncbi:unnamed protein product [Ectocarpus sp. 12 AP-2014]
MLKAGGGGGRCFIRDEEVQGAEIFRLLARFHKWLLTVGCGRSHEWFAVRTGGWEDHGCILWGLELVPPCETWLHPRLGRLCNVARCEIAQFVLFIRATGVRDPHELGPSKSRLSQRR